MIPFAYTYRSLAVRRTTTVATIMTVAVVVFVFSAMQMLSNGIGAAMIRSGDPNVALILRKGAVTEEQSGMDRTTVHRVLASVESMPAAPGVAAYVEELVSFTSVDNPRTRRVSPLTLRSVPPEAYAFHRVIMVEGRAPTMGSREAALGRAIATQYPWLRIGGTIGGRPRTLTVVGIFDAGGSAFDSEVWTDLSAMQARLGVATHISSVRVRLSSPERLEPLRATVEENTVLGLTVLRETEYYDKLGRGIVGTMQTLAAVMAVFFYLAAAVGAMVTMFANVAGRTREIATLSAIGFARGSVLGSFLLEAVILTTSGGAIGALAALATGWIEVSTLNMTTHSLIVWRFEPTPWILTSSALLAALVGLVGGLLPALRASRVPPAQALRQG